MQTVLTVGILSVTAVLITGGVLLALPKSKLRDFLMPIIAWCFVLLCGAWVISPFDGDFVPVVGWVDDAAAIVAGACAARTALRAGKEHRQIEA